MRQRAAPRVLTIQQLESVQYLTAMFASEYQDDQLGHDFPFITGQKGLAPAHLSNFNKLIHSARGATGDGAHDATLLLVEVLCQVQAVPQILTVGRGISKKENTQVMLVVA